MSRDFSKSVSRNFTAILYGTRPMKQSLHISVSMKFACHRESHVGSRKIKSIECGFLTILLATNVIFHVDHVIIAMNLTEKRSSKDEEIEFWFMTTTSYDARKRFHFIFNLFISWNVHSNFRILHNVISRCRVLSRKIDLGELNCGNMGR